MRHKNEEIHLFIIDEDGKRSARERATQKVLREWLRAGEQHGTPPQDPCAMRYECRKEEANALNERNQPARDEQESDFRASEPAEIGNRLEPLNAGSVWPERIHTRARQNRKIAARTPAVPVASSLISIIALRTVMGAHWFCPACQTCVCYFLGVTMKAYVPACPTCGTRLA